jgi:hypothetical protein
MQGIRYAKKKRKNTPCKKKGLEVVQTSVALLKAGAAD